MSEDDDPFLLIRGENRREERTPPCTSAQAAMRFPCLCWPVEVRQYLYPLWQKTGELISWLREEEVKKVKFVYHLLHFE